jgi:hypothetical protein
MLLSGGRLAFFGKGSGVTDYLSSIGYAMPNDTNPAEYMLDLVNEEFTDAFQVTTVLDAWERREARVTRSSTAFTAQIVVESDVEPLARVPILAQSGVMLRRQTLLTLRDPTLFFGRTLMFLALNCLFCIFYVKARDRVQEQVLNRVFVGMWTLGAPAALGVIQVYSANEQRLAVAKEVKNGMVHPLAHLLAALALQIVVMFVIAIVAYLIPLYAIMDYNAEVLPLIAVIAVTLW